MVLWTELTMGERTYIQHLVGERVIDWWRAETAREPRQGLRCTPVDGCCGVDYSFRLIFRVSVVAVL